MIKLTGKEKILIVRPDRLGDLVLSLPVAARLKAAHPGLEIHALVSRYNAPVLQFAGDIDRALYATDSDGRPLSIGELAHAMERESYYAAVFLKPGWRTAAAAFLADIPLRIGTSRRPYSLLFNLRERVPRRNSGLHEVDLNLSMLKPLGLEVIAGTLMPELNGPVAKARPNVLNIDGDYVVIHPGSGGSAPNWPAKSYRKLIELISRKRNVVITGTGSEQGLPTGGNIYNMINKTDFEQLMNLLAKAKLFISGSTGPLHLTAALGVPVLALIPAHQSLGPGRWGPRGKRAFALSPPKQNGHICRIMDDGSCPCMENLGVDMVYRRAMEILSAPEKMSE